MTNIFTFNDTLTMETICCYRCGLIFGVPKSFKKNLIISREGFFCPNGHEQAYGETKIDPEKERIKQELQQAKNKNETLQKRLTLTDFEWQKSLKEKRKLTRQMKRIHAGVCPCCNRSFENLARHMKTKHPDQIKQ